MNKNPATGPHKESLGKSTQHLTGGQRQALRLGADAEHETGPRRERLIRKAQQVGNGGEMR
jgi:hypothetical protein